MSHKTHFYDDRILTTTCKNRRAKQRTRSVFNVTCRKCIEKLYLQIGVRRVQLRA